MAKSRKRTGRAAPKRASARKPSRMKTMKAKTRPAKTATSTRRAKPATRAPRRAREEQPMTGTGMAQEGEDYTHMHAKKSGQEMEVE